MTETTDWHDWHSPYADDTSALSRRLRLVQRHIGDWLNERPESWLRVEPRSGAAAIARPTMAANHPRNRHGSPAASSGTLLPCGGKPWWPCWVVRARRPRRVGQHLAPVPDSTSPPGSSQRANWQRHTAFGDKITRDAGIPTLGFAEAVEHLRGAGDQALRLGGVRVDNPPYYFQLLLSADASSVVGCIGVDQQHQVRNRAE
ncbi:hypothetical protein ABNF97_27230 [Plantactinospora sp. B6F1]|uniref:hypothetical protein n=1 Tax=Plantactinospora sp. B6F1 TaxID=3158971 RepID=UPI0032D8DB47